MKSVQILLVASSMATNALTVVDSFTEYPDTAIQGNNDIIMPGMGYSVQQCQDHCLQAPFDCKSFEYHQLSGQCVLSRAAGPQVFSSTGWSLFVKEDTTGVYAYARCMSCIATGGSWQLDECHSSYCPYQDVGCATNDQGCVYAADSEQANAVCAQQSSCTGCTNTHPSCVYDPSNGSCFNGDNVWWDDGSLIRQASQCYDSRAPCPLMTCLMYCEHGFETDPQGCEICQCKQRRQETTYDRCLSCVSRGGSWQLDECHSSYCPYQDVGCATNQNDCAYVVDFGSSANTGLATPYIQSFGA